MCFKKFQINSRWSKHLKDKDLVALLLDDENES
jgi:hypothetical protein